MSKPVTAQIAVSGGTQISDTKFEDSSGQERYGSIEHVVLRKVDGT